MGDDASERWVRRVFEAKVDVPSAADVPVRDYGLIVAAFCEEDSLWDDCRVPRPIRAAASSAALSGLLLSPQGQPESLLQLALGLSSTAVMMGAAVEDERARSWARRRAARAAAEADDIMDIRRGFWEV